MILSQFQPLNVHCWTKAFPTGPRFGQEEVIVCDIIILQLPYSTPLTQNRFPLDLGTQTHQRTKDISY